MSLSERQKRALLEKEAVERQQKIVDFFHTVGALHSLSAEELRRGVTNDGGARPRHTLKIAHEHKGISFSKVEVLQLLRDLPLHLLACLLAREPSPHSPNAVAAAGGSAARADETEPLPCYHAHIAHGCRLLAELCRMCSMVPALSTLVAKDKELQERALDLINMVLLTVAGPEAGSFMEAAADASRAQELLARCEMVGWAFVALQQVGGGQAPSPRKQLLAMLDLLMWHPEGDVLVLAAFDALAVLMRVMRTAMLQSAPELDLYLLAYPLGMAMEALAPVAACEPFYARLLALDPGGAAPLRLLHAGMNLHSAPLAPPPWLREGDAIRAVQPPQCATAAAGGAAELLAARCAALLSILGDQQHPDSFLDSVVAHGGPAVLGAARDVAAAVCNQLALALNRPPCAEVSPAPGEAWQAINLLRLAELLTDDNTFREMLMASLARPFARLLAVPGQQFAARWCAGEECLSFYFSENLDIPVNVPSEAGLKADKAYLDASKVVVFGAPRSLDPLAMKRADKEKLGWARRYALEQAVLLGKVLGNLHHETPGAPHLYGAFARQLLQHLQTMPAPEEPQRPPQAGAGAATGAAHAAAAASGGEAESSGGDVHGAPLARSSSEAAASGSSGARAGIGDERRGGAAAAAGVASGQLATGAAAGSVGGGTNGGGGGAVAAAVANLGLLAVLLRPIALEEAPLNKIAWVDLMLNAEEFQLLTGLQATLHNGGVPPPPGYTVPPPPAPAPMPQEAAGSGVGLGSGAGELNTAPAPTAAAGTVPAGQAASGPAAGGEPAGGEASVPEVVAGGEASAVRPMAVDGDGGAQGDGAGAGALGAPSDRDAGEGPAPMDTQGGENGAPGGAMDTQGGENGAPGGAMDTQGGENGVPGGAMDTQGGENGAPGGAMGGKVMGAGGAGMGPFIV